MESVEVEIETDMMEIVKGLGIIKSKVGSGEDTSVELKDVAENIADIEKLIAESIDLLQSLKSDGF